MNKRLPKNIFKKEEDKKDLKDIIETKKVILPKFKIIELSEKLIESVYEDNIPKINKLLSEGAELNIKNKENKTVLDILIQVMANYHENMEFYNPIQIPRLIEIYEILKRNPVKEGVDL